jgi:hypothetical protein
MVFDRKRFTPHTQTVKNRMMIRGCLILVSGRVCIEHGLPGKRNIAMKFNDSNGMD